MNSFNPIWGYRVYQSKVKSDNKWSPKMTVQEILSQAIAHHIDKEFKQAETLYQSILEKEPLHSETNHNLGVLFSATDRMQEAIEFFDKALQTPPTEPLFFKTYLLALLGNRQIDKALDIIHCAEKAGLGKQGIAELRTIYLENKITAQNGIPLFFDNFIHVLLGNDDSKTSDRAFSGLCQLLESKKSRYVSFNERSNGVCNLFGRDSSIPQEFIAYSQGTHSVLKWKDYDVYKSAFDMALYWMLLNEMKPEVIIEIGSGTGGSAVWLADMAKTLGFTSHILSYDISRPSFTYPNVEFIEFDLNSLSDGGEFPENSNWSGKKLVIEDAHVNVVKTLEKIDKFLADGDYLLVEDSVNKQSEIAKFLLVTKNTYLVDQYYVDFFGRNGTSAINSIFKFEHAT